MKKYAIILFALTTFSGCATYGTKGTTFPLMYESRPLSVLVAPPINLSTAADAKENYSTTVTEPLAEYGYYVIPYELSAEILKSEGAYDAELFKNLPLKSFRDYFNADAVLFTTIEKWDMSYLVVASNLTVAVSCELKSTDTAEILWSYSGTLKVDLTDRSQKSLLGMVVATAINSAMADYVPYARKANFMVLSTMPAGKYHSMYGKDQATQVRIIEK
jgi:hypothetical protein